MENSDYKEERKRELKRNQQEDVGTDQLNDIT